MPPIRSDIARAVKDIRHAAKLDDAINIAVGRLVTHDSSLLSRVITRTKELGFCGELADEELAIAGTVHALERLDIIEPSPVRQREKLVHPSVVTDRPGRPVAAPCAISGCQYWFWDRDELVGVIDLLQNMIDAAPENRDVQAWTPVLHKFRAQLKTMLLAPYQRQIDDADPTGDPS